MLMAILHQSGVSERFGTLSVQVVSSTGRQSHRAWGYKNTGSCILVIQEMMPRLNPTPNPLNLRYRVSRHRVSRENHSIYVN